MKIYPFEKFDDLLEMNPNSFKDGLENTILTIGNFDGIHIGHCAVLEYVLKKNGHSVVFTFSNHPAEVLYQKKIPWLTTVEHRLSLLEKRGIDSVILVPFTREFSTQSPHDFLSKLKNIIPFSSLVLGHDAVIGHARKGDPNTLSAIGNQQGFSLEYIEPLQIQNERISSSLIRIAIQEGNLERARMFLGRPYSIKSKVIHGAKKGNAVGFRTANLPIQGICLPPFGVWSVEISIENEDKKRQGVANLGYAPTLHPHRSPFLEVHILDFENDLYGLSIEVFFSKFLRKEKSFESIEDLKAQIEKDIDSTRSFFAGKKTFC